MSITWYRIGNSDVAHSRSCSHMKRSKKRITTYTKKPSHLEVCDECKAKDRADKRLKRKRK